ncbi:cytochrome C [Geomesophilobacter sediminis]|uniref:Cytochrome C n=1 Tax=Geomesophilobacter sediminis TaxID=2798584 RepID=A0A8J7J5L5_9BACT|nr:cytochrome C [Geomesophilobacter sediminis]MBJ6723791.1 cytochrome C [Geomesophilobacter sediminis]
MTRVKLLSLLLIIAGALAISACAVVSKQASLPSWHPEQLGEGRPDCTECHEEQIKAVGKPSQTFKHTTEFVRQHRLYASQDEKVCALCHKFSFCNACHANELEIKPSTFLGNRPDRELPHRGDYLTLHMIDGKADPTSCYRCHGRSNNERCVSCHK